MPGRARSELVFLEQQAVAPARSGEMIEGGHAHCAPADDHDPRSQGAFRHRGPLFSRQVVPPGPITGCAPAYRFTADSRNIETRRTTTQLWAWRGRLNFTRPRTGAWG